jgi:hypothetical protein
MNTGQTILLLYKIALLTSGVAALVSVVGAWFVVRFTKPFDSYTEELARQLAKHQNLDKLVDETRRVTDAAETIKAALSHENWDRQQRWTAKRDLYVNIAEALGELRTATIRYEGLERLRLTKDLTDEKYATELETKRQEYSRDLEESTQHFLRALDIAPLMIPDEPYKPLREFKPRQIRYGTKHWQQDCEYNITGTQRALHHFHTAARFDLGFDPMEWKPTILTRLRLRPTRCISAAVEDRA